jgi:hypothetical protein
MFSVIEDNEKRRLTEAADILNAIRILRKRGVSGEEMPVELTRIFYVDLDAFNEVAGADAAVRP